MTKHKEIPNYLTSKIADMLQDKFWEYCDNKIKEKIISGLYDYKIAFVLIEINIFIKNNPI